MAKKPSSAQTSQTAVASVAPVVIDADAITDGKILDSARDAGNSAASSGSPGTGAASDAILALVSNSAPAASAALAGPTEGGGGASSSSGDVAASSEQSLAGAAPFDARPDKRRVPDFLDRDGKVRTIADDEQVAVVTMTKSVKIDGVFLQVGNDYSVPLDIWAELDDLNAVED